MIRNWLRRYWEKSMESCRPFILKALWATTILSMGLFPPLHSRQEKISQGITTPTLSHRPCIWYQSPSFLPYQKLLWDWNKCGMLGNKYVVEENHCSASMLNIIIGLRRINVPTQMLVGYSRIRLNCVHSSNLQYCVGLRSEEGTMNNVNSKWKWALLGVINCCWCRV